MKVIFVASGNKTGGNVSSFVRSQYESLKAAGLDMLLLPISGHGVKAYLKAAWRLRKMVRMERPDVVHAHYSVCGHVAWLACFGLWHRPKIVVSILGSFPKRNKKWRLVRFCVQHVWDRTLVKSKRTMNQLGIELPVIPNGVNLDVFHPMDYAEARRMVGFKGVNELDNEGVSEKKYVIWCSHPTRPEKNYALAQEAVKRVNSEELIVNSVELVAVYDKTPEKVCTYMNAANCLLLTSWSEGSPNVVKEAMACNCPIVTTDVGDVNERLEELEGCYVAKTEHPVVNSATHELYAIENAECIAHYLEKALEYGKRTGGRKQLMEDGLGIEQVAQRIKDVYEHL